MVALERLDLDAGDLTRMPQVVARTCVGRNAAVDQPGLDLAAADHRAAVVRRDLVGVAEMVERGMADDHQVDMVEAGRTWSPRPGFWSRKGSQRMRRPSLVTIS